MKRTDITKNIIKIALRMSVLSWYSSHFISIVPLLLYSQNIRTDANIVMSEKYIIFNI